MEFFNFKSEYTVTVSAGASPRYDVTRARAPRVAPAPRSTSASAPEATTGRGSQPSQAAYLP
jgi:hypothetical protein